MFARQRNVKMYKFKLWMVLLFNWRRAGKKSDLLKKVTYNEYKLPGFRPVPTVAEIRTKRVTKYGAALLYG